VDLATAAQAAHWFDLPAYYAEVRRVNPAGGIIALVSYGVLEADDDLDRIIQPFYRHVLASYWAARAQACGPGATARCLPVRGARGSRARDPLDWRLAELGRLRGDVVCGGGLEQAQGPGPSPTFRATWRAHGGQPRRSYCALAPAPASVACDATPSDLLETLKNLQHGESARRRQLYEPVTCRPRLAPVEANRLGRWSCPPVVQERRSEMQPHQRSVRNSAGRASPRQMSARLGLV